MSQNENRYNEIFDLVLKDAFQKNQDELMKEIPPEEEIRKTHQFSQGFQQRMAALFAGEDIGFSGESGEIRETSENRAAFDDQSGENEERENVRRSEDVVENSEIPGNLGGDEARSAGLLGDLGGDEARNAGLLGDLGGDEEKGTEIVGSLGGDKAESTEIVQSLGGDKAESTEPLGNSGGDAAKHDKVERKGRSRKKGHRIKRILAVAAACIVIVFISMWQFEPIRASVVQTILGFGNGGTFVTNGREGDYNNLFRDPSYLPQGYELIINLEGDVTKRIELSDGEHSIQISYVKYGAEADGIFDNERHEQEGKPVVLNKRYNAMVFSLDEEGQAQMLEWQDGKIQYKVTGEVSLEELTKIAESIMK